MFRSVVALLAGFAITTFAVLTATIAVALGLGVSPAEPTAAFQWILLACTAGAAAFGGYATATLAPQRPGAHALILAAMLLVAAVSSLVTPAAGQERWYLVAVLALSPACAIAGGRLRIAATARRAVQPGAK